MSRPSPAVARADHREPQTAKVLQKRELLAQVARRTGLRGADVKPVVEATLAELDRAIAAGMTLALPPLGRARITMSSDGSGGQVITLRLRRRASEL
ncbi:MULTISPECIES: HU family DNA-binding protein [unclassified Paracoccus (in: a-proteobacteria)]|uniref:HU family DNA-binding protein n=1 Tax=unclassified Paracoccus (in: a-proteobacteria) TaxID=2688777 RepID=UPI0012B33606|nr:MULTISPECIES: HU family DNA-binding protein [unclassified Paracoccus (in: a-proteobacteria)]UXU74297.1 HU family DNA-binding protein [Paracoccus sp. SMMA_5]UXU80187.1 HU family DNA-binding protein [Paracoccus sp. SMMA_5_TC]